MLNRRTLFIWEAESGSCLGRLEISDAPPGMADSNLSFNFLTASRFGNNKMIATSHRDTSCVNLFSAETDAAASLPTINMEELMGVPVKVLTIYLMVFMYLRNLKIYHRIFMIFPNVIAS